MVSDDGFSPRLVQTHILFNGICHLEKICDVRNFKIGFNTRVAPYRLVMAIHDLLAIPASLANNIPTESVTQALYSMEGEQEMFPC